MSKLADLIERMRAARGTEILTAREWLDELGIAGSTIKLGLLLEKGIGTRAGALLEYRLLGRYDGHVKRWRFAVWTDEEIAAERARRASAAGAKAAERQAELQANWEAKQTPEQRQARELVIPIQAPLQSSVDRAHSPPPEPEYLSHTRYDSEGRVTTTPVLGRDGQPVRAVPKSAPTARVPNIPQPRSVPTAPPATRHSMSPQAQAHRAMQTNAGTPFLEASLPGGFHSNGVEPSSDNQRWSQKYL